MYATYGNNYLFPVLLYSFRRLLLFTTIEFLLVAVVLTLVTNKNKHTYTKQYKNAVQTI